MNSIWACVKNNKQDPSKTTWRFLPKKSRISIIGCCHQKFAYGCQFQNPIVFGGIWALKLASILHTAIFFVEKNFEKQINNATLISLIWKCTVFFFNSKHFFQWFMSQYNFSSPYKEYHTHTNKDTYHHRQSHISFSESEYIQKIDFNSNKNIASKILQIRIFQH